MNNDSHIKYIISLLPITEFAIAIMLAALTILCLHNGLFWLPALIIFILGSLMYRTPWHDIDTEHWLLLHIILAGVPPCSGSMSWIAIKITVMTMAMVIGYYQFTDAQIVIDNSSDIVVEETTDKGKKCTQHSECEGVCIPQLSGKDKMKLFYEEGAHAFDVNGKCSATLIVNDCIPNINENGKADRMVCEYD